MITALEIRKKAERKYVDYLRSIAKSSEFEPIVISCDKKASVTMDLFQQELKDIRSLSKEVKGYGYTIEWKRVKSKLLGEQDYPDRIIFESASDFERFLRKEAEADHFRKECKRILCEFPQLTDWIVHYPQKVVDNASLWPDLLKVIRYFMENPCPNKYIRELPIEVHTKFIEQNKGILREILDILIQDINAEETVFEKRFGLRYVEPEIRLRLLDDSIALSYFSGINDLSIPISQFLNLSLKVTTVFVVENKINFLTFPNVKNSIIIWGQGYGVSTVKNSELLRSSNLIYWGDLDVQGFEILSQFRGHFPQAKSFLMDRSTFDTFFENDLGTPSNNTKPENLTKEESMMYEYIKSNNYRLEQEKIPQSYVLAEVLGSIS